MSFSDLRKNRKSAFAALQKNLEDTSKPKKTVDDRFWKLTPDTAGNAEAIIRFLPAPDGESVPYVKRLQYGFEHQEGGVKTGRYFIENAPVTFGWDTPDPVAELNRELWNSGDSELKSQASRQKAKHYFFANIYVVKDPKNPENEGTVRLFRFGKQIQEMIVAATVGTEGLGAKPPMNPFCLWDGADFLLKMTKADGWFTYKQSEFQACGTLENADDAQLESIWKRCHSLQELIAPDQFKSYDELKKNLDRTLGRTTSTRREEPAAEPRVDVNARPDFASRAQETVRQAAAAEPEPELPTLNTLSGKTSEPEDDFGDDPAAFFAKALQDLDNE